MQTENRNYNKQVKSEKTRKDEEQILMATWNIRGTFESGSLKQLIGEIKKYSIDIIALQETKQLSSEIIDIEDVTFLKSGGKNRMLGTGFIIQKKLKERIMDFNPISDRMCTVRLKGKMRNISILNIHAPTEEKEEDEKDIFYEQLVNEYEKMHKHDIKILVGDCNAKIGRESMYVEITGKYSKHENSNDNGQRIISFAAERNMVIRSTQMQRKEIYKGTWMSPDKKTINQIDHVLIEKKHRTSITNVRSMRGADSNSDHFLVRITCKLNLNNVHENKRENKSRKRYDLDKFKEEDIMKKYQEEINKGLQKIEQKTQIEEIWKGTKRAIEGANTVVLPKRIQNTKAKEWFDDECKKMAEEIRGLRQAMLREDSEFIHQKYRDRRKEMKRTCRRKKRQNNENKLKEIEARFQNKEIRSFYQEVKKMQKGWQNVSKFIRTKKGELESTPKGVVGVWKEHFQELLNDNEEEDNEENLSLVIEEDEIVIERPTEEEVDTIIKNLKNNKSPGESEITAEMIKAGGEQLHRKLYDLITLIWEKEEIPEEWNTALVCPIHKKGDKLVCENYRGISLLEIGYKILTLLLRKRLNKYAEDRIGEYQAGFRSNRSVTDQIFALKEIQTSCYEYKIALYTLFIDFKQAYDSINREKMYQAMARLGIPSKLIKLIKMTLDRTKSRALWNANKSEVFEIKKGLRQGDPLSTVLFNLVLETVIRNSQIKLSDTIFKNQHQCMAFADDLTLLAKSKKELIRVVRKLEKEAENFGLKINQEKTKYMVMGNTEEEAEEQLKINAYNGKTYKFDRVKEFVYLGVQINERGNEEQELKARIAKGNRKYGMLGTLLKSRYVSRKTKIRIYKTVIRPTVTYACETWVLRKREEDFLERWERKMLRAIYGGINTEEGWRRRTNKEIEELYNEPSITKYIKGQRLRWLGHIERLGRHRMTKMAFYRRPIGNKRRGRPRKRWYDSVQEDLQSMNEMDWRRKATNRKEWRNMIKRFMDEK